MNVNLRNRHFLTLQDFSREEINYLLLLAEKLKEKKKSGITGSSLQNKNIALIFEKPSTRTRCAFAVGAKDEGGNPEYLGKNDIQLGKKETVADTARVLGRMFDGIEYRGAEQKTVELLAEYSGVPVWNGLTSSYHPTQILADLMTIRENFQYLEGIKIAYLGDGRNNVAHSLMFGAALMGLELTIVAPDKLHPKAAMVKEAENIAGLNRSRIEITSNREQGIKGADVLYTDVWASMGEEEQFAERIELLKPYQVNMQMIENTGQDRVIFLHCLPAYHNSKTENGQQILAEYGVEEMEVTDQVFESEYSRVFDQAENRMHTIKAVMVATLSGPEKTAK